MPPKPKPQAKADAVPPKPKPPAKADAVPPKPKPKPKPPAPKPAQADIYAPARRATAKRRHRQIIRSFFLMMLLPSLIVGGYLWGLAEDQYASSLGFTVRREEAPSAVDILGGLSNISNASSSDSDILYEFIQSQEMVQHIDSAMDLRAIYSRHAATDPVFALKPDSTIEDLLAYWRRMVRVSYQPGTGLIELKALAFTPQEAQRISQEVLKKSAEMINMLSAVAREDAMRYAREELDLAVRQLTQARQALTTFRSRTQIVDPQADIQLQMGVLNTLQQRLGEELIALDLLRESTRSDDPRTRQSEQRIEAIRARIRQERDKFGSGGEVAAGEDYATLVAEFERLSVEQEFSEQKYTNALSNFDLAQTEAQRQSRYLASYLQPTLAERAEYPRRALLMGLAVLFLTIAWATGVLIYYALRDRR